MQSYWDQLEREVMNKSNTTYFFGLTNLGDEYKLIYNSEDSTTRLPSKQYYLKKPWEEIYLTQREAECVQLCLMGKSMKQVGVDLDLSPRTIEFYLKNIKEKMGIRKKSELLSVFNEMHFAEEQVF